MYFLPKPLPNDTVGDIFEICVMSIRNAKQRELLLGCKDSVETDSENYEQLVPSRIEQFAPSGVSDKVSDADLVKVYTQKFAPEDTPGRKYYDAIMAQTQHRRCPICGVRIANTLEHYLPKSEMPTLCVTPSNLIPACRDCNMDKGVDMCLTPSETPIHIYFDRNMFPDEPWLHVNIESEYEVTYYARCPDSWEVGIRGRVEKHLDYYKLHELYSSQAVSEIANMQHTWRLILKEDEGSEKLRASIHMQRVGAEKVEMNSWRAALYRGLEENLNKVTQWLVADEVREPMGAL